MATTKRKIDKSPRIYNPGKQCRQLWCLVSKLTGRVYMPCFPATAVLIFPCKRFAEQVKSRDEVVRPFTKAIFSEVYNRANRANAR